MDSPVPLPELKVEPIEGMPEPLLDIGLRYWALIDDCPQVQWAESVRHIGRSTNTTRIHVVAGLAVRAYVPDRTCSTCNNVLVVRTRQNYIDVCADLNVECANCHASEAAAAATRTSTAATERVATATAERVARERWRQAKVDKVTLQYPQRIWRGDWFPAADVRAEVSALALLRYAPDVAPIPPVAGWDVALYPGSARDLADLVNDMRHAELILPHPASPVCAWVWEPATFEAALEKAHGDLDAAFCPQIMDRWYPLQACFYVPWGPDAKTAANNLDRELTRRLAPAGMTALEQEELLDLVIEVIAEEALRYFNNQLDHHNLPAVSENHAPRLRDAVYRAAHHRSLGDVANIVWRAVQSAAANAQAHPRAPRVNMTTSGVNRLEEHARRASNPQFHIKTFTDLGYNLSAVTRTLFYVVLDKDPFTTSAEQVIDCMPPPRPALS